MNDQARVSVKSLNDHLICVLCGGYFISATAITECLHTFCKDCIVRYLETSIYCPVCDTLVHKTKPTLCLRRDNATQDLVYKLVPKLLTNEVQRRRAFYSQNHPPLNHVTNTTPHEDHVTKRARKFFTEDEKMSVQLLLSDNGKPVSLSKKRKRDEEAPLKEPQCRYLLCPALLTIGLVKKFLRLKLDLKPKYQIDVFHTTESLKDHFSLMDIAYIYNWTRAQPLALHYSIYDTSPRPRPSTKRVTYNLPPLNTSPPPSPYSSPEYGVRSFNQGFYIRETSHAVIREISFSKKCKRKRGRPKKLQPVENRNFTFQNTKDRLKAPVCFAQELLSDIEADCSECSIRGVIMNSNDGGLCDQTIDRVPRSSTPVHDPFRKSPVLSTDNDSGYEASDMPKDFAMLRFNSDEETD
ncbi:hypothetical protein CAPTEDRAFT_170143 [Capitella teleta]|uniref:RING-type domain-containing protein n=1 Tax=Capitella teleta TaxID=283909 RepID=R7TA34_CAPTE|nr:hypothetical protein CAPTEDRAFT_170143 [Capitella teleta]|eukprot:ELT90613.1 hypothetical protein CAPTEDRAFT_170143 [Capitella teleta]